MLAVFVSHAKNYMANHVTACICLCTYIIIKILGPVPVNVRHANPPTPSKVANLGFWSKKLRNALKRMMFPINVVPFYYKHCIQAEYVCISRINKLL